MAGEIKILVKGRPSYERWSIYQWILEYKDILENEYRVEIKPVMIDGVEEYPEIIIGEETIHEPLFEEGYIIEAIKKILDKVVKKQ